MKVRFRNSLLVFISILVLVLLFYWVRFRFSEPENLRSIYLIPQDAVYFIETEEPIKNWEEIKQSPIWNHLKTNTYFSELTKSADSLDLILHNNKKLFDLLGSKKLLVSAHAISKTKQDFLFVVDLKKTARLIQLKTIIKKIFKAHYAITERMYNEVEILEFYHKKSRETLYISVINNNLIASHTHTLVEAAIKQLEKPTIGRDLKYIEINKNVTNTKKLRLFVQFAYLDELVHTYTHSSVDWVQQLSKMLIYSGFDIDLIDGKKIVADGYTNLNDTSMSYLQALQNSGIGKQSIAEVAPQKTSMYISFGFENYQKFYQNYLKLQENNTLVFKAFEENKKRIEKLLDIDVEEHFISWIDDEIALLNLEKNNLGKNNDFALILKAKNKNLAQKNLNHILKQIKKNTPVKFKEVSYKGYPIRFMSIKGFFKIFFAGYFKDIETPYFTRIDNYVVFSNHPNTLKYIITNFIENNTLEKSTHYKTFKSNFKKKSNLFLYINTPLFYNNIQDYFSEDKRRNFRKNKKYFTSFSQIGVQFEPKGNIFKSRLVVQYKDQESLLFSEEFKPDYMGPQEENNDNEPMRNPLILSDRDENNIDLPVINPTDLNADEFIVNYPNGKVKFSVALKDGKKHGRYKEYYKDGELRVKGYFKNDKRVRIWRKYDTNGKRILKIRY